MNTLGDVLEESGSNLLVGRILLQVNRNEKLLSLGIDIADVDTTLVCEENPIALVRERSQHGDSASVYIQRRY